MPRASQKHSRASSLRPQNPSYLHSTCGVLCRSFMCACQNLRLLCHSAGRIEHSSATNRARSASGAAEASSANDYEAGADAHGWSIWVCPEGSRSFASGHENSMLRHSTGRAARALWISEILIRPIYVAESARVVDFLVPEACQGDNL